MPATTFVRREQEFPRSHPPPSSSRSFSCRGPCRTGRACNPADPSVAVGPAERRRIVVCRVGGRHDPGERNDPHAGLPRPRGYSAGTTRGRLPGPQAVARGRLGQVPRRQARHQRQREGLLRPEADGPRPGGRIHGARRRAIRAHGGADAVNSFTRFYLALLGTDFLRTLPRRSAGDGPLAEMVPREPVRHERLVADDRRAAFDRGRPGARARRSNPSAASTNCSSASRNIGRRSAARGCRAERAG